VPSKENVKLLYLPMVIFLDALNVSKTDEHDFFSSLILKNSKIFFALLF